MKKHIPDFEGFLNESNESKAKSEWNRLDSDSREDILLRFVKNPDEIEKLVTKKWDYIPDYLVGNKHFLDAVATGKGLR